MATAIITLESHKLPDVLLMHHYELQLALGQQVPGTWPEESAYLNAHQPKAIAAVLIEVVHTHLANAAIGYIFKEDAKKLDKQQLGSAQRVGGKIAFFTGLDFIIEINWTAWMRLAPPQRVALIDHELCHCVRSDGETGPRYELVTHDVEEFSAIVHRWGLWKNDLARFARVVRQQRDLFEEPDL
jgi:hypothetical protein